MMQHLTELIRQWAEERNLQNATANKQVIKLGEEFGELCQGMAKDNAVQVYDSIGDMYVVLTILCMQLGISIEQCVSYAYDEIKDRKGEMVNGVFVKEEDLEFAQTRTNTYSKNDYEEAMEKGLDLNNLEDYLSFYDLPF